jgi:uridine kinase
MSTPPRPDVGRAFVVAISGPPGAGKSTLTQALQRRFPPARTLFYDYHRPLTRLPMAEVRAWFARGGDPNEVDHGALVADLVRAAAGPAPLLLFETPFARLLRDSSPLIDFVVWIDAPLDLALSRALLAITEAARTRPPRNFLDWQRGYLASYPAMRTMYLWQRDQISASADLTLDGAASLQAWVDTVAAHPAFAAMGFNSASS